VHGQVAKAIAEDLAAGGVDVRLVEIDQTDEYYRILQDPKRAAAGEWDITPAAFMPDWFGNNGRSYVQPMFQSNTAVGTANYGGYHNPQVDDLIDRALSAPTEVAAAHLWHQVDRQVLADVAIVPILVCEPTIEHLTSARVRDAIPLPHVDRWYDVANLWLDPPD
jgi:peptide/nickel transport system substrate-binding protein